MQLNRILKLELKVLLAKAFKIAGKDRIYILSIA